ncbi:hypothetical protein [Yoonia sp. I 8.24]|uniref:hypothetical protein n=1 Tax=Yoonia sp. I 8.24 TaxID=1537229 RepID=UPI001EE0FCF9|nr:hypothetical protein [Yoonia sp. I 8.24]MCG3266482.1 hypothetical protein [Yoonia sp. I 8.24]
MALFALGYFGRGALSTHEPRDQRFISLWDQYCAPFIEGNSVRGFNGLVPLEQFSGTNRWADPSSKLVLEIKDHTCEISDVLLMLSPQERIDVEQNFVAYVAENYPQYIEMEQQWTSDWDLAYDWRDVTATAPAYWGYPPRGVSVWGISLERAGEQIGFNYTSASLRGWEKPKFNISDDH